MDAHPTEIQAFLGTYHPFDLLPAEALSQLCHELVVRDVAAGTVLMTPGDPVDTLYIVRSGAVETREPSGQLLARLSEGECFGVRAILRGGRAVNRSDAIEDSRLLLLPATRFHELCRAHPPFAYHFAAFDGGRLRDSLEGGADRTDQPLTQTVGSLLTRGPVTIDAAAPIRAAARKMRDERVSCLLVTRAEELVGIFTDRDLRNRVVAEEVPYDQPVESVMSRDPYRIDAQAFTFDALLLMSRHNIHHLPVVNRGAVVGCLTSSTVLESHATSPLLLARNIKGCTTPQELKAVVARVPELVCHLADSGATAFSIGRVVSTLTDGVTLRLIELAEEKLGPPPVPYVWLAAGSQGRQEQSALSDQDNCMFIHDDYREEEHGAYFKALATQVCDGLNVCGYVYCPGGMMAMTDQWRKPVAVWREYFRRWIEEPEPKALMLSCVFFDLRPIHGAAALFEGVHEYVVERSRKNRIFQAYMAGNALTHVPPLGFFRNFVLISGGEHNHTLDLKHNGSVPVIDIARVCALAAGAGAVGTQDRLAAAGAAKTLSADSVADLTDALEFINLLRLKHQVRAIRAGKPADNYLAPEELSSSEKGHLKNAFAAIKAIQASLALTYQLGRF